MNNSVRDKLYAGEKAIGAFVWTGSETVAEALGYSGLDYIIIDSEHSPVEHETALGMVRAAKLTGLPSFVRVKDPSRSALLKMLDIGAEGLIIPYLQSVDEVRQAVSYGKYPPVGQRGFVFGRRAGYGYAEEASDMRQYANLSNDETLLLPMCETWGILDSIEEVVSIDGVDGIFVGPFDLSIALGAPGQFDTPVFQAAIDRILKACHDARKYPFSFVPNAEMARAFLARGFVSVTISMDIQVLVDGYRDIVAGL